MHILFLLKGEVLNGVKLRHNFKKGVFCLRVFAQPSCSFYFSLKRKSNLLQHPLVVVAYRGLATTASNKKAKAAIPNCICLRKSPQPASNHSFKWKAKHNRLHSPLEEDEIRGVTAFF